MSETPDEIIERQGQMIVKQAEENAELRAEIERLKVMGEQTVHD